MMPSIEHLQSWYLNNRAQNPSVYLAGETDRDTLHLTDTRNGVPVRVPWDIIALPSRSHRLNADAYYRDMTSRFAAWNDVGRPSIAS